MTKRKTVEQVLAVFIFSKFNPYHDIVGKEMNKQAAGEIHTATGLIGEGLRLQRNYPGQSESTKADLAYFYECANRWPTAYYITRWVNSRDGVPVHSLHEVLGTLLRFRYHSKTVRTLRYIKEVTG